MTDETLARARALAEELVADDRLPPAINVKDLAVLMDAIEQPLQQQIANMIEPLHRSDDPEEAEALRCTPDYVLMTRQASDAQSALFHKVRDERDALQQQIETLHENEGTMLRKLSDALTGGNAGTWDEIVHAAEQELSCKLDCDSPSYPPNDHERRQCGCNQCLSDLLSESRARVEQLEQLPAKWREYQATSEAAARKASRQSDLVEQHARQAEACTLNVCIMDIEAALASPAKPTTDHARALKSVTTWLAEDAELPAETTTDESRWDDNGGTVE